MPPKRTVLLALAMATLLMAQDAADTLPVSVAVGSFRGARGLTTLEIYFEVPRENLIYKKQGRRFATELGTAVLLKFQGQIVEFADAALKDRVASESATARGVVFGTNAFSVRPGEYDLQVVVEDGHQRSFETTIKVTAPVYSDRNLDMSTVQLARSVRWASPVSATSRLGLTAVPNAAGVWPSSSAWLWYYLEVYGLATTDSIILATSVWLDTTLVHRSQPWRYAVPSAVLTERGALRLQNLPPGQYRLVVEAWAEGTTIMRQTDFTLVPPDSAAMDTVSAWSRLKKGERRALGAAVGSAWSQFIAKRYRGMNADGQLAELQGAADITGLDVDDLILRWRQSQAFDAAYRGRGLSLQAGLIMRSGIPQEVRVAPATYLQPELQRWSYGAEGPRYFFKDLSGRGYFAIVDTGHVPQQYMSMEAVIWPPDTVQMGVAPDSASAAADSLMTISPDTTNLIDSPPAVELPDTSVAADTLTTVSPDTATATITPVTIDTSNSSAAVPADLP